MEDIIVIKRVGIIGMGALGMLYGDFIAKNITREAVTFIVDEKRKKAYQETVFTINVTASLVDRKSTRLNSSHP